MGSSYYHWSTTREIPLLLNLISPSGGGATGLSPEVAIRRWRDSAGNLLDGHYWDGAAFTATPTWLTLTEVDAVNSPGAYEYNFEQPGTERLYLCYFRHTVSPIGFAVEQHIVTDEIYIPQGSPAVPVLPGDTVMGRLAAMEDPTGDVAQANADAVWDETLVDHLLPGSTGEALYRCSAGQSGSRQIDITVEDSGAVPIQGAVVDVFDATNTQWLFRVFTNVTGEVSVALDDGIYNVRLFASGYSFTVPEILTVTADAAVTYTGSALVTIPPPSSPNLCVIYGTVDDAGGNPIAGACVEAFANTPQSVAGRQKGDRIGTTKTAADGTFQIELVRLTAVEFKITDQITRTEVLRITRTVPDSASQALDSWT